MGGERVSESAGRATIGDVADRAGVSIATVSRVANDRYGVASATAERVRRVIDELGYESNLIARSMRSQRTDIIGVMVSGIEPFSAELLKGIASELRETGFGLIVYSGGMSGEEGWERRYLSRLSDTLADGTILVAPTVIDVESSHPIVAVDPHVGGSSIPTVASQNYEGARAATEHLIELGHRRIGFLAGRRDLESARRREAGYRAALEAAGIPFDPDLIQVGGFTEETARQPAAALLGLAERPTAIFAANDLSAIQVLRTAGELGLDVPGDLSRRRIRQHPRVGAHRAAADHRRPVDPGARPGGRAHPRRADQRPGQLRRPDPHHPPDQAHRPPVLRPALIPAVGVRAV